MYVLGGLRRVLGPDQCGGNAEVLAREAAVLFRVTVEQAGGVIDTVFCHVDHQDGVELRGLDLSRACARNMSLPENGRGAVRSWVSSSPRTRSSARTTAS